MPLDLFVALVRSISHVHSNVVCPPTLGRCTSIVCSVCAMCNRTIAKTKKKEQQESKAHIDSMFYLHRHQFSSVQFVRNIELFKCVCVCVCFCCCFFFLVCKNLFRLCERFKRKIKQNKSWPKAIQKRKHQRGDTRKRFFFSCFIPKTRDPSDLLGICIIEINNRSKYTDREREREPCQWCTSDVGKNVDAQNNWYSIVC